MELVGDLHTVGKIAELWRYPVKSMRGERVEASAIAEKGLVGDRAFALYDIETGKIASAKSPRMWPNLLEFAASFVEPPTAEALLPPVRIEMPGGRVAHTDDPAVDEALSEATGRAVRLVTSNPEGAVYEQYVPSVDDADPEGSDFFREFPNDLFGTGSLHDASPIHLVTSATLERLAELYPEGRFDVRRFRPNVLVQLDAREAGFVENGWLKSVVTLGTARIRVTLPTLRCVMTTRPQGDLPHDLGILQTAAQHNRLEVLSLGRYPCVGVNALVVAPGTACTDDPVHFVPAGDGGAATKGG